MCHRYILKINCHDFLVPHNKSTIHLFSKKLENAEKQQEAKQTNKQKETNKRLDVSLYRRTLLRAQLALETWYFGPWGDVSNLRLLEIRVGMITICMQYPYLF